MNSSNKHLLIVSYYFPPFARVGGRRWAKFAKYLYKNGWNIEVVAGDFQGSKSPWDKDVLSYADHVHRVDLSKLKLPYFKTTLPKNPVQKVKWKLSQWKYEKFTRPSYKGDFTDPSYLDGPAFANKVKSLLAKKSSISSVVISVGPFLYALDILRLKKSFPEVRFYLDYRDLWLIPDSLNEKQDKELQSVISETNQLADVFLAVNDNICNGLKSDFAKPGFVVPHGFDDDDFDELPKYVLDVKQLNFVYGGDLYHGSEVKLEFISLLLQKIAAKGVKAKATFYIDKRKHPLQSWPHLEFKQPIGLEQFLAEGAKADFLLIIRSDLYSNVFSTKVFELARLKRPILVVDKKGALTDFIEEKQLGFALKEISDIEQLADKILLQLQNNQLPLPYDLTEHSFVHITEQLQGILNAH